LACLRLNECSDTPMQQFVNNRVDENGIRRDHLSAVLTKREPTLTKRGKSTEGESGFDFLEREWPVLVTLCSSRIFCESRCLALISCPRSSGVHSVVQDTAGCYEMITAALCEVRFCCAAAAVVAWLP
jgi:hypothetical protein